MTIPAYDFHPACLCLPKMADDEYEALRASIAKGFDARHPILLCDGMILDGRHRYNACRDELVDPVFIEFKGGDPFDHVRREHEARRSWAFTEQKYMVCKELKRLSDEWQRKEEEKHATAANKARAEAAKAQHEVSKPYAGEKMVTGHDDPPPSKKDAHPTRKAKAEATGVSESTVKRADYIEKHAPELAAKVKSGELSPSKAIREIKRAEVVAKLEDVKTKEAKAVTGVYDVIVMDPPWPMEKIERDVRPNQSEFDYPTMSEAELAALEIPAADDCHMWLWTTHKHLPMALRLLAAWRFKYVCTFVWHKPGGFQPIGLPQYNCEFALYARKGSPQFIDTKAFNVCFQAPRGKHSEKPGEFYDVVRRVTAGRRIDMFNRRAIEGFDVWGKEATVA